MARLWPKAGLPRRLQPIAMDSREAGIQRRIEAGDLKPDVNLAVGFLAGIPLLVTTGGILLVIGVILDPRSHGARSRRTHALLRTGRGPGMGWLDKLKNKKDEAQGAAKERVGKATDDDKMEREGKTDQTKSNLKQAGENVKDAFDK